MLHKLVRLRPYLYHLTATSNVARIQATARLEPASQLLQAARRPGLLRQRRPEGLLLELDGQSVHIRDQAPLHPGNCHLGTWSFEDLVGESNSRVFFWPGTAAGPSDYGRRHFARYAGDAVSVLRVPFEDLLRAKPEAKPELCRYNSGSPRWSGGKPSPRVVGLFTGPADFSGTAGEVVEVVFPHAVRLPDTTDVVDPGRYTAKRAQAVQADSSSG